MTREQFEKAENINREIQKYKNLLAEIENGIYYKKREDEQAKKRIEERKGKAYNDHSERWTLSKFFSLRFREKKVIVVPHYEFAQGIEIDVDAELIGVIIDYLEKKKKEFEVEFERIVKGEEQETQ